MNLPSRQQLEKIYGENRHSMERFQSLAERFQKIYHARRAEYFTSPGRTEIIGNHTDHNGGKVLAASISMDTIGAALPNGTDLIRITSEGYRKEIVIPLSGLKSFYGHAGTEGLVAGMLEGMQKFGFRVAGFDACLSTNVIPAAGVSSSASFEMLICSIVNHFFNNDSMTCTDYAKIGKYAENVYWRKASGMMDQMACAVGGTVLLDFADSQKPRYRKINFSFQDFGHRLVIVNTGKGHADLSQEYSEIPKEMRAAAGILGADLLHETSLETLLLRCNEIPDDRVILRSIHFFEENARVERAAECIASRDFDTLLSLISLSGDSSWKYLQNCYSIRSCHEQKVSLTLALTDLFLKQTDQSGSHDAGQNTCQNTCQGACRVHGGGFAGVIMCVLPEAGTENYMQFISRYVGKENVYPMDIRSVGAVHISD